MGADLFSKCREFYEDPQFAQKFGWPVNPRLAQAIGLYPFFIPLAASEGPEAKIEGRRFIMIGSNNYLGLTHHPQVIEASAAAVRKYGTGTSGPRILSGTLELHLELEEKLAALVDQEKALVFSTGFLTNLGTIPALLEPSDLVLADRSVHASIIDAMRMSRIHKDAKINYFGHRDMVDLARRLERVEASRAVLVVVDGVFSMEGDIAPIPTLAGLCRAHGARLMVDDAHSIGVLGAGRGTGFHFGCQRDVDLVMGTFSKSLASIGGFIAGRKDVIHWIQHFARPHLFSASLAPANVAAVLAALDIITAEPERIERVNHIGEIMRHEIRGMGYDIGSSQTPIIPVVIGDQFRVMQAWEALFKAGVYANVALPPAVPSSRALLRTSYMATHTDSHLDQVLSAFRKIRQKLPSSVRAPEERLH